MRSIFSKVLIGYIIIISLMAGLILFFTFGSIKNHYMNYLINDLKNNNQMINSLAVPYLNNNYQSLDSAVKAFSKHLNYRISIIDSNGKVIADSKANPINMENHKSRPEIIEALKLGNGVSFRYSKTVENEMLYVAMAARNHNVPLIIIRSSLYSNYVNDLIDELQNKVIQIAIIVFIVAIIFAIFFAKNITNPVKKIVDASKMVANGDFNVKVNIKSKSEIKDLANSFNYMTEHIDSLFVQLNKEKEKLNALIKTLHEALIVVDDSGKIIIANNAFEDLIENNNIIDKYFWEVITDACFNDLFKSIRENRTNKTADIYFKDRYFLGSINHISSQNNFVVILYDISDIKALEQIKKDFIVNVSHELRTPLTAIKGFVETMEEDANNEQIHYLEIIHRHTDRLINIVNDLLVLSNLEDDKTELVYEKINLETFTNNVLPIFQQKINNKNIKIKVKIAEDTPEIEADQFKLEQMFINLVDNAIKYTDLGSIKIKIKPIIYNNKECVKIEFSDSGIGMTKEELNRIFERFYVIDKSRSRKVGGTGLGLSIVKHIVLLHKGEIRVSSQKGEGSTFTIILPIKKTSDKIL